LAALGELRAQGFDLRNGSELGPQTPGAERESFANCLLTRRVISALQRLNPDLPCDALEGVVRTLAYPPHPTLIQNNRWFHGLLVDGMPVEYRDAKTGEMRGGRARLVDFDHAAANDWLAVRQLIITGPSGKHIRPDLLLFLNGLPVVVIELKDPADDKADLGVAIDQLRRYMQTVPNLFVPNVLCAVSDGMLTR